MSSSFTSQQLVVIVQQHACLNSLEQKLLIHLKTDYSLANSRVQLKKLVDMALYQDFSVAEEQLMLVKVAIVKRRRRQIKNIARKLALFNYFIRTCTSRFDTDEQ